MRKTSDDIVISDVRFPNEIKAIHNAGGKVVRVVRGADPEWYQDAYNMNCGPTNMSWAISKARMEALKIHSSETAWIGKGIDLEIDNNGTIDQLFEQIRNLVVDRPDATERPLYVGLVDSLHTLS
jgi:hypothetical protein